MVEDDGGLFGLEEMFEKDVCDFIVFGGEYGGVEEELVFEDEVVVLKFVGGGVFVEWVLK